MTRPGSIGRRVARSILPGLALALPIVCRAAAPLHLPDTIGQRVQPCMQCHGKEGRATNRGYFPRIAGKPAGYLFHQLVNFREGRRHNETMAYLVDNLSDAYLQEIAGYFAALDLPYPPPVTAVGAADTTRGEALVRSGDASRGIPACAACHGAALTGVAPAIPGLLGLPRDYLAAQFGAWRSGERRAAAPDCMGHVAAALSADDVATIANWLAAQPVPAHGVPAPAPAAPLPLACGSVPAAAAR